MVEIKKILLPSDFSERTEKVCSYALSLAGKYGAEIDVIHVIHEDLDMSSFYVPHISFDVTENEMMKGAEVKLKTFCDDHLKGKADYEIHVRKGTPFNEIIEAAKAFGSDIIVMGTEGKTGIEHAIFGSTAERVLKKSPIPVLTVR